MMSETYFLEYINIWIEIVQLTARFNHLVMVSIVYVLITLLLLVFPLFNIRLSQCDNLTRKKMSQFVNLMKMKLTSTLQAE